MAFPHLLHRTCTSVAPDEHGLRSPEGLQEVFSLLMDREVMGAAHRALSSGNCCKVDPEVPLLHALCSGCACLSVHLPSLASYCLSLQQILL